MGLGTWNNMKVDMVDNHIMVFSNGSWEIYHIDKKMSPKLASGKIAVYSEDAYMLYNIMDVSPK